MTAREDAHEAARERPAPRCPVCGRPRMDRWRPFCSKRCADVDLGRWLGEAYRIPAVEAADEEDDARVMGPEET